MAAMELPGTPPGTPPRAPQETSLPPSYDDVAEDPATAARRHLMFKEAEALEILRAMYGTDPGNLSSIGQAIIERHASPGIPATSRLRR